MALRRMPLYLRMLARLGRSVLLRRVFSGALIIVATVYVIALMVSQWQSMVEAAARFSLTAFIVAVTLLVVMGALKAVYHIFALRRLVDDNSLHQTDIALTYAVSQIVRYVPGKVFGIVYEANELASKVTPDRVVLANVVQMLHTSVLSVAVFIAVAAWVLSGSSAFALGLLGLGAALLWLSHRAYAAERLGVSLSRFLPAVQKLRSNGWGSRHFALTCSALLLLEWLPYYGYWSVLLPPGSDWVSEAILFGSCYAAAAMVANLAVVMPSGLIIREALFVWLGTQLSMDAAHLLFLAAVSRSLLVVADLALVLVVWILRRSVASSRP